MDKSIYKQREKYNYFAADLSVFECLIKVKSKPISQWPTTDLFILTWCVWEPSTVLTDQGTETARY